MVGCVFAGSHRGEERGGEGIVFFSVLFAYTVAIRI